MTRAFSFMTPPLAEVGIMFFPCLSICKYVNPSVFCQWFLSLSVLSWFHIWSEAFYGWVVLFLPFSCSSHIYWLFAMSGASVPFEHIFSMLLHIIDLDNINLVTLSGLFRVFRILTTFFHFANLWMEFVEFFKSQLDKSGSSLKTMYGLFHSKEKVQ